MEFVLGLWGVLAAAFGVMVLSGSKSAIHEILAGMGFLVATISIGSAGIIYAVNSLKKKIQET
jgi:hypothetical protein